MFKLEIKTGGAAFCNCNGEYNDLFEALELIRLLKKVSGDLVEGKMHGSVIDSNGNKVGSWSR